MKDIGGKGRNQLYDDQCQLIYQALQQRKPEEALKRFSELFEDLQIQKNSDSISTEEKSKIERTVGSIRQYIELHYCDNTLTVGRISDEFQINQSYLSREYKKITGVGILEYISQLRLKQAKLLLEKGCTVGETALQVGYFDTQPLVRLFRQMEGVTPSEYRQNTQKNNGSQ